ncbi:helix-turn-helix domain-containing protein [Hyphomicrobium sp. ghe19]|uniref:helix-turn-helix domain-containing protein n=1 Tax=Hyphomicrobium sp. ghe19 TaxID=2682968 RepID=UPI001367458D|nr:hypothetical protein HYPP_03829 [Hyphomicrobium sp. ghe19]
MSKNRVREIRKLKKLTLMQAAEKIGISHSQLARIETSERGLTLPMAEQIAQGLEWNDVAYLIGIEPGQSIEIEPSFAGDAEAFEARHLPFKPDPKAKTEPWRILRPVLDLAGLPDRAIAFVDTNAEGLEDLKPLEKVLGQYTDPRSGKTSVVVRQFLPPYLLTTNSDSCNEIPVDMRGEVILRGIIRSHLVLND